MKFQLRKNPVVTSHPVGPRLQHPIQGQLVSAGWTFLSLLGIGGEITRFFCPEGAFEAVTVFDRKPLGHCTRRTGRFPPEWTPAPWDPGCPHAPPPPSLLPAHPLLPEPLCAVYALYPWFITPQTLRVPTMHGRGILKLRNFSLARRNTA